MPNISTSSRTRDANNNIAYMPEFDKLDTHEKSLCESLKVPPKDFLELKSSLIKENAKNGAVKKSYAQTLGQTDRSNLFVIFDFLVKQSIIVQDDGTEVTVA